MFLSTSQDLLYIVLALCILWFTVFLCWLLYQAARTLKNANEIVENLNHKLELITEAVRFIRDKMDTMSTHVGVVGKFAAGLVEKYVVGKLTKKLDEKLMAKDKKSRK